MTTCILWRTSAMQDMYCRSCSTCTVCMWTACVHYVKTYANTPWQSNSLQLKIEKEPRSNSSYGIHKRQYSPEQQVQTVVHQQSFTLYSQARIPTSWWETVAHHDRTSLINQCTQHTTWTVPGENILYRAYSATYKMYMYDMHVQIKILLTWLLVLSMKLVS